MNKEQLQFMAKILLLAFTVIAACLAKGVVVF